MRHLVRAETSAWRCSWLSSKRVCDGHTGARTQDHSVISTALYRLSYTTARRRRTPTYTAANAPRTLSKTTLTPYGHTLARYRSTAACNTTAMHRHTPPTRACAPAASGTNPLHEPTSTLCTSSGTLHACTHGVAMCTALCEGPHCRGTRTPVLGSRETERALAPQANRHTRHTAGAPPCVVCTVRCVCVSHSCSVN